MPKKAELRALITGSDAPFQQVLKRAKASGATWAKGMGGGIGNNISQGFKKAGSSATGFALGPLKYAAAALAGYFTIDTFKSGIQGSIELGESLYNLQKRTGLAVSEGYMLGRVFKQSGVDIAMVGPAVNKMQRSITEAAKTGGVKGGVSEVFERLNISVTELAKMKPAAQFKLIGSALSEVSNPALKAAYAMKIFGRSGGELIQTFDEVKETDFGGMTDKAKVLQENAQLFHQITVAFKQAGSNLQSVFLGIAKSIGPDLLKFAQSLSGAKLEKVGEKIGNAAIKAKSWTDTLAEGSRDLGTMAEGAEFGAKRGFNYGMQKGDLITAIVGGIIGIGKGSMAAVDRSVIKDRPKPETPTVTISKSVDDPYKLLSGTMLGAANKGIDLAKFQDLAKYHLPFKSALGIGADQAWGQTPILHHSEMRKFQDQQAAIAGNRDEFDNGHHAIRRGDHARRKAYLQEQEKQKLGIEKSNEILEKIDASTAATASALSDSQ